MLALNLVVCKKSLEIYHGRTPLQWCRLGGARSWLKRLCGLWATLVAKTSCSLGKLSRSSTRRLRRGFFFCEAVTMPHLQSHVWLLAHFDTRKMWSSHGRQPWGWWGVSQPFLTVFQNWGGVQSGQQTIGSGGCCSRDGLVSSKWIQNIQGPMGLSIQ